MPSPDELRRRYRELSDDDLRRLAREEQELTPEAQRLLQEEVRARHEQLQQRREEHAKRRAYANDDRVWENEEGHYLTLGRVADDEMLDTSNLGDLRVRCRAIAEREGGGLIEAEVVPSKHGPAVMFVYKTRDPDSAGYIFTGVLQAPTADGMFRWTFRAHEIGMTGVREAMVTAQLFDAGELTPFSYESTWARDPYDPEARGVEREALRFISDDAEYDEMVPAHPLTAVRAVLWDILKADPGGD